MNKRSLSLLLVPALCLTVAQFGGCTDDEVNCPLPTTSSNGGTGGTGAQGPGPGGGGTGGSTGTGTDTCPGEYHTIDTGDVLVLEGDTTGATDDYQSICGDNPPGSSGPDVVFAIEFLSSGTLQTTYAASGGLDPVMYLRHNSCSQDNPVIWCKNFSNTARSDIKHIEAGIYFLILDGADNTSGPFTLNLSFEPAECGDGVVNPGEGCDDGNMVNNDGCLGDCSAYEPGAFEDCADPEPFPIDPGAPVIRAGTTIGNTHEHTFQHTPNCGDSPALQDDAGGGERVYAVVPSDNGDLTLRLGYQADGVTPQCDAAGGPSPQECWDRVLHVRHTLDMSDEATCRGGEDVSNAAPALWVNPTNQIACDMLGSIADLYTQEVVIPDVIAGQTYFVFVDSPYFQMTYGHGNFHLYVQLN